MVQQNRRTTRKGRGGRAEGVSKKMSKLSRQKPKTVERGRKVKTDPVKVSRSRQKVHSNVNNTDKKTKLNDDVFSFGQKVKVINDIETPDGTLYKNEVVRISSYGGLSDFAVVDSLGRAWYVNIPDITSEL